MAALGAVVIAVASLVREPVELTLLVAAVVVAILAGWDVLVHRGARRYVAGAIVAGALVGVVLLFDLHAVLRIIGVVVLVLGSTAAARVALHDVPVAPSFITGLVGPAARGVLVMNPRSGGGRVGRFDLENEARARGITPIILRPGDDLRALAEGAVAGGADVLGMAGGDGSQALIADVARRHGVAMVCVPAGTRNHFALGLDRGPRRLRGRCRRSCRPRLRERPGVRQQCLSRDLRDGRPARRVPGVEDQHGRTDAA